MFRKNRAHHDVTLRSRESRGATPYGTHLALPWVHPLSARTCRGYPNPQPSDSLRHRHSIQTLPSISHWVVAHFLNLKHDQISNPPTTNLLLSLFSTNI